MLDRLGQASPRPRPDNPVVESWLDGIPASTTKPTPEELRQWDLDDRGHSGRGALVTGIVIRSFSFLVALITAVLIIILKLSTPSYYQGDNANLIPALAVTPIIVAWDAAEFITLCARRGRGISPRVHVWVDGLLFLGVATAMAILMVDVIIDLYDGYSIVEKSRDLVGAALLVLLMLFHSFLFFFYFCARLGHRRKKITTPRIMYLPTGQAVVVTARPLAIHRANPRHDAELTQLPVPQPATPPYPQAPAASPAPAAQPYPSPVSSPVDGSSATQEPFRQGVPPRKPVAGAPVGTHYAMPWPGPDYQPDEAEKARAARGEKQAQWMTLHGMGMDTAGGQEMGKGTDPNKTRREELDEAMNASAGKARILV